MFRVEDKYDLSDTQQYILKKKLAAVLPYDGNSGPGGYKISSIYFDDLFDTHYNDAVDGNPIRKKYRIRIYNDSLSTIKLEVKEKKYSRIFKRSAGITEEELWALAAGERIPEDSDPAGVRKDFNLAVLETGLRPKVIVTYDRVAFTSRYGNVRITFDTNVRASTKIDRFGDPELLYDHPVPGEGDSILEVKYDEYLPDYIAQLIETGNLWQSSYSKYKVCRDIYTY